MTKQVSDEVFHSALALARAEQFDGKKHEKEKTKLRRSLKRRKDFEELMTDARRCLSAEEERKRRAREEEQRILQLFQTFAEALHEALQRL